ncbi:MAG: nucleoside deaminase [Deltaproteobacteria bacterium]|nr:nucleoside deaminase [Deltaproteobacteria bacterium]
MGAPPTGKAVGGDPCEVMPAGLPKGPFPDKLKESLMRAALAEARAAFRESEIPAGALVCTLGGEVLARAHNRVIGLSDPSAHAEILALREASRLIGNHRLTGLALFSTLEPCPMCLSCALQSRLEGIVYGAREPKWGALGSVLDLNSLPGLNHRLSFLEGGVLAEESALLMRDFFKARRKNPAWDPGSPLGPNGASQDGVK